MDAASGTSGAGRSPSASFHHPVVNESFSAYGLINHRHTPEMEQAIGAQILFTAHLAPMTRGILATCYGRAVDLRPGACPGGAGGGVPDEPFVQVSACRRSTRDTYGSNTVQVTARYDERTGLRRVARRVGQSRQRRRRTGDPGGEHRPRPGETAWTADPGARAVTLSAPGFVASGSRPASSPTGSSTSRWSRPRTLGPCQQGRCSPRISWRRRPCRSAAPIC